MEKPVVVLYDNVANAYKDPFYPPTRGVALREFQDAVKVGPITTKLNPKISEIPVILYS